MSVINKLFSVLLGCGLVIAGAVVFCDGIGFSHVVEMVTYMFADGIKGATALLVGGVFVLVGAALLLANLCIKPPKAVRVPGTPKNNAVYVTLNTIENMAKTTAMAVPGVVSVSTKIKTKRGGICLRVKISVTSDDKITAVTEHLQDDIKTLIEGSTSLNVLSVGVLVVKAALEKNAEAYREDAKAQKYSETTIPMTEDGEKQSE